MNSLVSKALQRLSDEGLGVWCDTLQQTVQRLAQQTPHGHAQKWQRILHDLPELKAEHIDLQSDAVSFGGPCSAADRECLRQSLMELHPWRKGPFRLFELQVDAEWRSDLKWSRIRQHLSLSGKNVLDVGCGNGYYGWRMLGDGARSVFGLEPYSLYNSQFLIVSKLGTELNNFVLPASDAVLAEPILHFDVTFSMGVLYHSKDPFGHLRRLRQSLTTGGTLVLETLVVDGDSNTMLIPKGRYAKMRNVWMLPSTLMLERILERTGFRDIHVVDVSCTTSREQRRTDWMTFESLADFLNPDDLTKTVEGEPAPKRAMIIANI